METRVTCPTCQGVKKTLINFRFSANLTKACTQCGGSGTVPATPPEPVPVMSLASEEKSGGTKN